MPIVIGAKPESSFNDPIGLLTDCHRRIERFLGVLARLGAEVRGEALTPEQRTSLETALRYFREAAPKHTADEEDSLFPRLRAHAAAESLAGLEADHERADADHAAVDGLGREWLASGSLTPADAAQFASLTAGLAALYRDHIAVEEGVVFPLAARLLPAADRVAIAEEMAARRQL